MEIAFIGFLILKLQLAQKMGMLQYGTYYIFARNSSMSFSLNRKKILKFQMKVDENKIEYNMQEDVRFIQKLNKTLLIVGSVFDFIIS